MTPKAPKAPPTPGRIRKALAAIVEAHEQLIAHRVGIQMGVFKMSRQTRLCDHNYWMALCDAATAGRSALAAASAASGQGENP